MIGFGFSPAERWACNQKLNENRGCKPDSACEKIEKIGLRLSSLVEGSISAKDSVDSPNSVTSNLLLGEPKKKGVNFSKVVGVILIPTRQEYEDSNLSEGLYWTDEDYERFKESTIIEVKNYQKHIEKITGKSLSMQEAKNELYRLSYPGKGSNALKASLSSLF